MRCPSLGISLLPRDRTAHSPLKMDFAFRMLWSLAAGEIWEFSQGVEKVFAGTGWPWSRRVGSWPVGAFHCSDTGDGAQPQSSCCPSGTEATSSCHHLSPPPLTASLQPQRSVPRQDSPAFPLPGSPRPQQAPGPKLQLGFLLAGDGQSGHSSLGNNTSLLIFSSLLISESFK